MKQLVSHPSHPRLTDVRGAGNWSPLLSRLGGWHETGEGTWTDGVSWLSASLPADFAFTHRARSGAGVSPAGFGVSFKRGKALPSHGSQFVLNHISVNVPDVDGERAWLERHLGSNIAVIARESAFNPITKDWQPDAHLFRRPYFYITIRGTSDTPRIDHYGWMCAAKGGVERAASILRELKWPVVLGPEVIDGSYLPSLRGTR
jgi:hypothetical protein